MCATTLQPRKVSENHLSFSTPLVNQQKRGPSDHLSSPWPIQGTIDASATLAKASISVSLYHPRDPDIHRNNCRGLTNTHLKQIQSREVRCPFVWLEYLPIWSIWVCMCDIFVCQTNIKGKRRYTLTIPMHWAPEFKETCIYMPCFWPAKPGVTFRLDGVLKPAKTHGLGRMIFANSHGFSPWAPMRTPLHTLILETDEFLMKAVVLWNSEGLDLFDCPK